MAYRFHLKFLTNKYNTVMVQQWRPQKLASVANGLIRNCKTKKWEKGTNILAYATWGTTEEIRSLWTDQYGCSVLHRFSLVRTATEYTISVPVVFSFTG